MQSVTEKNMIDLTLVQEKQMQAEIRNCLWFYNTWEKWCVNTSLFKHTLVWYYINIHSPFIPNHTHYLKQPQLKKIKK